MIPNIAPQARFLTLVGTALVAILVGITVLFPSQSEAARECPPNLTLGPGTVGRCLRPDGTIAGSALDPSVVNCPAGGYPMLVSNQPICANADGGILNNSGGVVTPDNPGNVSRPEPVAQPVSSDCDGVLFSLWSPFKCFFRYMIAIISAGFIYISSWILVLGAKLFEYTLFYTVIQFNILFDTFKEWVEKGWQVFRDLANIGIIGIFVFIAISFILGLKEYGEKRLIANVLIVAVLINFSLLFTKIIINGSNAVSAAVYNSQLRGGSNASGGSVSFDSLGGTDDSGIAGRFVRSMGLSTFRNSVSQNIQLGSSEGMFAQLLYGILFSLLLVTAAFVFLYGAFLLIARAILLFLLMITSAAAFATYMIPSLAKSEYGWSTWWSSLLRSAVLIPVMMVLLSISIGIAEGISRCTPGGARACGSLGNLAGNPTAAVDLRMLLNYIFVLGFLFATFKIASALSHTIAGLKFGVAPQLFAGGLAGAIGGRGLGWGSFRAKKFFEDRAAAKSKDPNGGLAAARASTWAKRFDQLSKKSFNPLETKTLTGMGKSFGLSGAAAGQFGIKPYAKNVTDKGHELAEQIAKAKLKPEVADKHAKETKDTIAEERQRNELREQKEARKETLQQAREQTSAVKESARAAKDRTEKEEASIKQQLKTVQEELATAAQTLAANPSDTAAAEKVQTANARSAILMKEHSSIIERAKTEAQHYEREMGQAMANLQKADAAHTEAENKEKTGLEQIHKDKVKRVIQTYNEGITKYLKKRTYNPDIVATARHDFDEQDKKAARQAWRDMLDVSKPPPAAGAAGGGDGHH